jgi:anti-sigma factor RsiW
MDPCRGIQEDLVGYCGGDLNPDDREKIRFHLERCDRCRAELAREVNLRNTLGSLPRVTAPADLEPRIRSALAAPRPATGFRSTSGSLVAAAALAAAVLAVVFLPGLRPDPEHESAWTDQEIAAARREAVFTLALTARIIDRTKKDAVADVFADRLPHAINAPFKTLKPTTGGGNG